MSFNGLHIAQSGMRSHRWMVEVAASNVANASTVGYTRRSVNLASMRGGGVNVDSTVRVRDVFAHNRLRASVGREGHAAAKSQILAAVEDTVFTNGSSDVSASLSALLSTFESLAGTPQNEGLRHEVLVAATAFTETMNRVADGLVDTRKQIGTEIQTDLNELNRIAARVADLNRSIADGGGSDASPGLVDERDQLVAAAAELAGVNVVVDGDNFRLNIGGIPIVQNGTAIPVSYTPGTGQFSVAPDGLPVRPGGSLAARVEAYDTDLPAYIADFDTLTNTIVDAINAIHASGVGGDGGTGRNLFTGTTGSSLRIDPAVAGNPQAVAAAAPGEGALDGSIAAAIAEIADNPVGPVRAVATFQSRVATDVASAVRNAQAAAAARFTAEETVINVSGVSIDEELSILTAAQTAFEASARVFTAVDEMLDIIMRTGLVGR